MRIHIAIAVAFGLAASACEFVKVQPVPTPIPLPLPTVSPGSSRSPALPPTPQQMQAAMGALSTAEVCDLLYHPTFGNDALSEIKQRGDFSDYELSRIMRGEIAEGMSEDAVRCAYGDPNQIQTAADRERYDLVYRYRGDNFTSRVAMLSGETRVYFLEGAVVDFVRTGRPGY